MAENGFTTEQRLQALEAALASAQLARLFQGGIIGLVLGGSTAWFVARNVRRTYGENEAETKAEEAEDQDGKQGS